jgi:hypothetical protein
VIKDHHASNLSLMILDEHKNLATYIKGPGKAGQR